MPVEETSVFLNVPFDRAYEKQFIALIASIIALGRRPRSVLEVPDGGVGRLARIVDHVQRCRVSLHDLSRATRLNMPFELGLAVSVASFNGSHDFFVLQQRDRRLDTVLSDLKGIDHSTHHGTVRGTINAVLDILHTVDKNPELRAVYRFYRDLSRYAAVALASHHRNTLFSRLMFGKLIEGGALLAARGGLIDP